MHTMIRALMLGRCTSSIFTSSLWREKMRQGFRAFEREYRSLQNLRCVEIGVWEGGNAKEFVDGLRPIDAWLVDPWADWKTQPEVERDLIAQMGPDFGEQTYQKVVNLFKGY